MDIFQSIFEHTPDSLMVVNQSGRIAQANPQAARMFGYGPGELNGLMLETLVPDRLAALHSALRSGYMAAPQARLMGGGEIFYGRRSNGSEFPLQVRLNPLETDEGPMLLCALRDVDLVRHNDEAALRESEERFRNAFTSAAIGMAMVALDGRWLRVNESLCQIVGYSEAEMLSSSFRAMTHPDDLDANLGLVSRILAGEIPHYNLEKRYLHKEGRVVWCTLSVSLVRDRQGEPLYFISQIQDITARKEAEQQLAAANRSVAEALALLDMLNASAPAGLAFIGRDYRFIRCNDALAELNRMPAADHIGRLVSDVVPGLWPQLRQLYDTVLSGDGPILNHEIASAVPNAPGKARYWLGSYYPVQIEDEIIGIGVMITEITERKRLEEQLRQSQKMQAIGQLAGGVAHDFNNLLTVINGYSDMLLVDLNSLVETDHPAHEAATSIRDAGERAALLTRQLLMLSRKTAPEPVALILGDTLHYITRMLRRLIGEDIDLATWIAPDLYLIRADHGQIEQMTLNLALNARDAMPTGGRLTIEARNVILDADDYHISSNYRPGPYVQLTVSDTGQGMTQSIKEHLFEPFFTTKAPGKGTGLGLAIVYGIVEQSDGFISVYSEPGIGTAFHIFLPAIDATAIVSAEGTAPKADLSGSETILLVEDEEGVRRIARLALETLGYRVIMASGGPEALTQLAAQAGGIDLLITDVVMPEMSGRQLADTLRARNAALRVLFMSGYAGEAISRHSIIDSAESFLQKPFTPFTLARSVRETLDR